MAAPLSNPTANAAVTPPHFFADLYTFQWQAFSFRQPGASAAAVAICLFSGILAGHPGGGLIAGGGAFTIGFGANQRISDSRLIPMIAAVFATSTAALIGTLAGHRSYVLVVTAAMSAFIYGMLTAKNAGLSWVGQQASIALVVASAFPTGVHAALVRTGLLAAGGAAQIVLSSVALRLFPSLRNDFLSMATTIYTTVREQERELVRRLRWLPKALPALSRNASVGYSLRLALTMAIATEIYRRLGIQSGYWIPMTALLVQKPAFFETLTRALARILGTLVGAWLCSLLIAHFSPDAPVLAGVATLFALLAFATNGVNYGLYSACLTSYIVFLLSLNQIPGPVIAHRRAWCTILGGAIALVIHLDAMRRHRAGT